MSGGMIKIGIFGICKVCFDLLGAAGGEVGWGVLVIVIGAVSSVLGVVYALGEHDLKSLLAYHSVENIGIILLGCRRGHLRLGRRSALARRHRASGRSLSLGEPCHVQGPALPRRRQRAACHGHPQHGGARRPGEGDAHHGGVLPHRLPRHFGLPPLNGFVSEWFTYQGLIGAAMDGGIFMRIVFAFAVVALAITGALAVTCFVKAFGVTFLARPRSEAAEHAHEVPAPMTIAMSSSRWPASLWDSARPGWRPLSAPSRARCSRAPSLPVVEGATLVSLDTVSVVSPLIMAALMAVVIALCALVRNAANRKGGMEERPEHVGVRL